MSSSKEINALVPLFNGVDYCAQKEWMTNFLGSQHLLGYVTSAHPCPAAANPAAVTVAEQVTMADWDKVDLQVKSLIALRLSPNLHTHLDTTSEATWDSLETTFGASHFTMDFHLLQEVMRAKLHVGQNPQVEIHCIWTLLERIFTSGMILDNYLQAMLLLSTISCEWDNIASMYCKNMTRAWASFDGVHTAMMAEYDQIACPSQLAHHMDRISAVKHKGKSPQFKEQRPHSGPKPPAADEAPSRLSSNKQRRGGKREKA